MSADLIAGLGIVLLLVLTIIIICLAIRNKGRGNSKNKCCPKQKIRDCVSSTFNVGVTPAGLAVTDNGCRLYVANNNNYGVTGTTGGVDSVTVINLKHNQVETTIFDPSFNQPFTVTIDDPRHLVYITNSNSDSVSVINQKTNTVIAVITGFDGPSGLVILPGGAFAYVNNYGGPLGVGSGNGTTVSIVNLDTRLIVGTITVGLAPAAIAVNPSGQFVYTVNYQNGNPGTGTLSVIDVATSLVVHTVTGFSGPFDIALTRDGLYAYVTNFGSNNFAPFGTTVSVVDLTTLAIVATIDVGIQPSGIAICGQYAYVTNYNTLYSGPGFTNLVAGEGTVQVIDTKTNLVVGKTIVVGQSPANIACNKCGVYVSNWTSNTVSIIH